VGRALLLTGRPGVGKTTVIREVISRLGRGAGGFYTAEVREQGQRTGFRLVALDGPQGTLAGVNIVSPYRVGRYGVHLQDLEQIGVEAIRRALRHPDVAVVVVDEIGKMELLSAAFREAVQAALDGPKPLLATVMAGPQPWVNALKARSNVTLVEVTPANRQTLPGQIMAWLRQGSYPEQEQSPA